MLEEEDPLIKARPLIPPRASEHKLSIMLSHPRLVSNMEFHFIMKLSEAADIF